MARKRHAKPASPPSAAPIPQNQENQIEALATFLDTGSPLHEPIQSTGSQTEMPTFGTQGLPQDAYNPRSKEDHVRSRILIDRSQNSGQYIDVGMVLRGLKDEQECLEKEINTTAVEFYDYLDKSRKLVSEAEQSKGFEEHKSQSRDSQVLHDLKESIGTLTGHISNDERNKLHARLQIITEQMKATPLNTKILLSHPDGSPNEQAFEQEAAVQKMLLGISDLEANIKLWAYTVNKAKEPAKEGKEAKEPASDMSGKRNKTDAERKQSAIKGYMQKFNIDEETAKQRWPRVYHTRLLEARIMAQTSDEVEGGTEDPITKIEPLRIRSRQSYESTAIPPMDTQGRELTANANPQARDATTDAISAPKPDLKTKSEAKTEIEQPVIQGLVTARGENMMAADGAPLPTAEAFMYADVTHPEEIVTLWIAFWGNDKRVWGTLHEYVMKFPVSTRDDVWESHMDWLARGKYEPLVQGGWVHKATAKRVDKIASRLTEELPIQPCLDYYMPPFDSIQLITKLKALQGPSGEIELMKKFEALQRPIQDLNDGGNTNPGDYDQWIPIKNTLGQIWSETNEKRALGEEQLQGLQFVKLEDREIQQQKIEGELKEQEGLLKTREKRLQKLREQPPKSADKWLETELQRIEAGEIWRMRQRIWSTREALKKSREGTFVNDKKSSKKHGEQLQKPYHQSPECTMQQQEIERLLKLREEHLHRREKQQLEVDGLLQRLKEQLQERESRLAEREARVHDREVEWEKHQEQRQEIERMLQQRDVQLQKRDDQVQTREEQSLKRAEQLLFREGELRNRLRVAEVGITLANQQAAKVQREIEKEKAMLAVLSNGQEDVKRVTKPQDIDLSNRTYGVNNREAAVSSHDKCLEQPMMNVHDLLKILNARPAKPCKIWARSATEDWPSVLELAVRARMFAETRGLDWGQNEIQLAALKKMAAAVEERAKKIIFSGQVKVADLEKPAADKTADDTEDATVFTDPYSFFASKQWLGSEWNSPAATSTEDIKPAPWDTFEAEKLPASTPINVCSGKWGCGCTLCRERDEIWKLHMPSSKNNGVGKPCKCNGGWGCNGGSGCRGYEDDFPPLPKSLHRDDDSSDW
ncbi:hypothetical protein V496_07976 [Pseudogymnoascus sp. VKM F-4515 (FW-2607)]|nr:hypothetical protein V496_07976 [Pseudogymnoascus sp. VKM F-4515 (FW-2607)]